MNLKNSGTVSFGGALPSSGGHSVTGETERSASVTSSPEENSPNIGVALTSSDASPFSLLADVDSEAAALAMLTNNNDALSGPIQQREVVELGTSISPCAAVSAPREDSTLPGDGGSFEKFSSLQKSDEFIDMLVFGDEFYKHGKLGCTLSIRHVSVSTDLLFLCWSHLNNIDTAKRLALKDVSRYAFL